MTVIFNPNGQSVVMQDSYNAGVPTIGSQAPAGEMPLAGGLRTGAGMGGPNDKSSGAMFQPRYFWNRGVLEILYQESWAVQAAIDIPVDDMFVRWREFDAEEEEVNKTMEDMEDHFESEIHLSDALKMARLYGSSILVFNTDDNRPDVALDEEKLGEDSLRNMLVVDRYSVSVAVRCDDLDCINFGKPEIYHIALSGIPGGIDVHWTRCLRFDGVRKMGTVGSTTAYDYDFGNSVLPAILEPIIEEAILSKSIGHMAQEASIAYVKTPGARTETTGQFGAMMEGDKTPDEIGAEINKQKSLYNMMFIADSEEFGRVAISFGGLAELIDKSGSTRSRCGSYPGDAILWD